MQIVTHQINDARIAEIRSDELIIRAVENGIDLLGNIYYQGFDRVILYEKNITPGFFELKTGMAGEILQKFSNYRVRLVIVGGFEKYQSKSLRDFISESNRSKLVNFVGSLDEALQRFSC